jgi:hypothetical protein
MAGVAVAQEPLVLQIHGPPSNSPALATVWNRSIFASYCDPGAEALFVEESSQIALVRITAVEEAMAASTNMEHYVHLLRLGINSNEVRMLRERGGHPLAMFARMPDWLSSSPHHGHRVPTDPYTISQASPPSNYVVWAAMVSNTVAYINGHLGADMYYEVWNEPNSAGFWQGNETAYLALYNATVLGARAADPHARIGGPTVSFHNASIGTNTTPLIRDLLHHAATTAIPQLGLTRLPVDFISWHEFGTMPDVTLSNSAAAVRGWMAEAGGFAGTKLIIDEWQISDPEGPPGIDARRDTEFAAAYSAAMIAAMARAGIDYQCMASFQDFLAVSNMFYGGYGMLTKAPRVVRKSSYHVHASLDAFAGARTMPSGWATPLSAVQTVQLGAIAGRTAPGSEWLLWCFTPPSNMLMHSSYMQIVDRMRVEDPASLSNLLEQANVTDPTALQPFMMDYLYDASTMDPIDIDPYWEAQFGDARALSVAMMSASTNRLQVRLQAPVYSNVPALYEYRLIDDRHSNAHAHYQQALTNGLEAAITAAVSNQEMTVTAHGELAHDGSLPIALDVGPFSVHWISITTNGVVNTTSTTTLASTSTLDTTTTTTTSTTSTTTAPYMALSEALDNTRLVWTAGGDRVWAGQSATSQDGVDAVQSGAIGPGQQSWLETVVTGATSVGFWWKLSAETNAALAFEIDGARHLHEGGVHDWRWNGFHVPVGVHTLRWVYAKSPQALPGVDGAWLDGVAVGLFGDAQPLGNGWYWSHWFGTFYSSYAPWVYHHEHAWLRPIGENSHNVVFWDPAMGAWWWTSSLTYSYLYRFTDQAWLWYLPDTKNPRWMINLKTGVWERR